MANRTVYVDGSTSGTPGTDGAHYATLAAAVSGEASAAGDLVTDTAILNIEISLTSADTTQVDIDGFTTSASYYINIYTTAGARHAGVWSASKYRLATSDAACALLREEYIRFTGIQFTITDASANRYFFLNIGRSTGSVYFSSCIFKGHGNASYRQRFYGVSSGAFANVYVWNSVMYGWGANSESYFTTETGAVVYLWNVTCIWGSTNNTAGVRNDGGTLTCKNVYSGGAYVGRNFYGTITQSYCAASDTSADGTGAVDSVAIDDSTFKSVAGNDYHLAGTGSALYGVGADNTGDTAPLNYATDIDGNTITGRFDIGADWYYAAATSQFARPSSDVAGGTFRSILVTAPFGPRVIA